LNACRAGNLAGAGAEMLVEQAGEMPCPDPEASRKRFNRRIIECARMDQPDRALDRRQ